MKKLKSVQVKGVKYELPKNEIEIEKLIQRGASLNKKLQSVKADLEAVKVRLTEIGLQHREQETTINLQGISGKATITFRESYQCKPGIELLKKEVGDLYNRLFIFKQETKPKAGPLKKFLAGDENDMKKIIIPYLQKKETKPNVKIETI